MLQTIITGSSSKQNRRLLPFELSKPNGFSFSSFYKGSITNKRGGIFLFLDSSIYILSLFLFFLAIISTYALTFSRCHPRKSISKYGTSLFQTWENVYPNSVLCSSYFVWFYNFLFMVSGLIWLMAWLFSWIIGESWWMQIE